MSGEMESNDVEYVALGGEGSTPKLENFHKVSIIPLIFLIFYEVSGGPFGVEDTVKAAGPCLALFGFLIFPFIWSVPEALITAEMGTIYPALGGGFPRIIAVLVLVLALTYMNYRVLTIVGWAAVLLGIFSLLPFMVMGIIAIPRIKPTRWIMVDLNKVNWGLYLNTLFWNLNYWDSISTLAGEVDDPGKSLPRALFYAVLLVVLGYFLPLLVGTGAMPINRELWSDGYFSEVAKAIGGVWLRCWVQTASALSNMGMFVAEISSDSFQLLGMAERGMVPEFFAKRSPYGTPLVGILFSASGVVLLSWLSFQEIVAAENFLYCFGMLMEFVAFVKLRRKFPYAKRPYKVPVGKREPCLRNKLLSCDHRACVKALFEIHGTEKMA
ncbi:unnamed protein product [Sphenostylis stenocarpa]|uniref:Amino acid permease/ SLC12A domain-containing protein n=1 Tax=Sphenostylis stenocarpa TaxID=92480 RepID=A0AA87B7Y1_9FABA|nr:unnamed protein product [Sphenostylis stenocarpa]